jgi:beta-lactamase superfamily II metal-dependent hydrolase
MTEEHPEADLLKVAHHGSVPSTIPLLLERVHPRFAIRMDIREKKFWLDWETLAC